VEQITTAVAAVVFGIGGIAAFLWLVNQLVIRLPERVKGSATVLCLSAPHFC
jgi:hypothetical protein